MLNRFDAQKLRRNETIHVLLVHNLMFCGYTITCPATNVKPCCLHAYRLNLLHCSRPDACWKRALDGKWQFVTREGSVGLRVGGVNCEPIALNMASFRLPRP